MYRMRGWIFGWIAVASVYWLTRLWRLGDFPLFIDEGGYLWYAENLLQGDLWRGFGEGKPLIGWIIAPAYASGLAADLSARLPHVMVGFVGLMAATWLAHQLFGRRVALTAGLVCVVTPSLLFLGRLATPDVVLGALAVAAMALTLAYLRRPRWWLAGVAGGTLVLAVLAKSPVGVFFFGAPLLLLWAERARQPTLSWRRVLPIYAFPALFVLAATVTVTLRAMAGVQPLGFGLHEILAKTGGAIDPAQRLQTNLPNLVRYLAVDLSWPLAALAGAASIAGLLRPEPALRALAVFVWLWVVAIVVTTTLWAERYLAPVLYPVAVIAAWAIVHTAAATGGWFAARLPGQPVHRLRALALTAILAAVVLGTAPGNLLLLIDYTNAPIAAPYLQGYGAGFGMREAAMWLENELSRAHTPGQVVALHVSDYMRLHAYAGPALRSRLRQVHIVAGQNQDRAGQARWLAQWRQETSPTYIVLESTFLWDEAWQQAFPAAQTVAAFPKPGDQDAVLVMRLP